MELSAAETLPKQHNSSASLASENGGRWVARFNVTTPVGVAAVPPGGDAAAPADGPPAAEERDSGRDASPSRFRVEFVDEPAPGADDRATISSGGGGTPAGGHSTYYDTHQKTFGHNTLETLPHADHYRNLLSATGHIRKRPTLLELHELAVCLHISLAVAESLAAGAIFSKLCKLIRRS